MSALLNSATAATYTETQYVYDYNTTYDSGDVFTVSGSEAFAIDGTSSASLVLDNSTVDALTGFRVNVSQSRDSYSSSGVTLTGGFVKTVGDVFTLNGSNGNHGIGITINGGAKVSSDNGVLMNAMGVQNYGSNSSVINITGNDTIVKGTIVSSYATVAVNVSDGGKWIFEGSNSLSQLIINNGTAEFVKTSPSDSLTVTDGGTPLSISNGGQLYISFTEDFIEEIMGNGGYYQEFLSDTIVGSNIGNSDYSVASSNDTYKWTVVKGDGYFEITNITPVPEPSAVAALIGGFALAFAAYRRKALK